MEENRGPGQPPFYATPEEMQIKIDEYFDHCKNGERPTISNLSLSLGFVSRQSFYDYSNRKGFKKVVDAARKKINPYSRKAKYNYTLPANRRETERYRLDPARRLRVCVSTRIRQSLKNKENKGSIRLLPYTVQDLRDHLESLFKPGMSWDNYGEWHIDHIKPVVSFNIESSDSPDFLKCWALSNLQPLWAADNIKKGSFYE